MFQNTVNDDQMSAVFRVFVVCRNKNTRITLETLANWTRGYCCIGTNAILAKDADKINSVKKNGHPPFRHGPRIGFVSNRDSEPENNTNSECHSGEITVLEAILQKTMQRIL